MGWTDERVELLKKLWADGLSASQIAAELGGVTRNAVIGKVHRLGLSGRAKSPSSAVPRPRKPRSTTLRISRPAVRGNTALAYSFDTEEEPEQQIIENVVPMGQRRTILELNEHTCRWPVAIPSSQNLFLRRQYPSRTALLLLSLAHRLSAGLGPAAASPRGADVSEASRMSQNEKAAHSRGFFYWTAARRDRQSCGGATGSCCAADLDFITACSRFSSARTGLMPSKISRTPKMTSARTNGQA